MKTIVLCLISFCIALSSCIPTYNAKIVSSRSIDSLTDIMEFCLPIKSVNWKLKTYVNNSGATESGGVNKDVLCAEIECDIPQLQGFKNSFVADRESEQVTDAFVAPALLDNWFSADVINAVYEEHGYLHPRIRVFKVNRRVLKTTFFNDGWFGFIGDDKVLLVLSQ